MSGDRCTTRQIKYRKLEQREINYVKASLRELECCMLPDRHRKEVQDLFNLVDSLYVILD